MKLTYITPASRVINLAPMQMLATSDPNSVNIVDDNSKAINPNASFSNEKSWNSQIWSNIEK